LNAEVAFLEGDWGKARGHSAEVVAEVNEVSKVLSEWINEAINLLADL
jgi:hypothetical protein